MPQFRKKPVVIEAIRYTGGNRREIQDFTGQECRAEPDEKTNATGYPLVIKTLEGQHIASLGDWIIRGVKGEFYPCKPDVFAATYDTV
jgi:hypothetical protein